MADNLAVELYGAKSPEEGKRNQVRTLSKCIYLSLACLCMSNVSSALDYNPTWPFLQSIGNQIPAPLGDGFLVYNSATGEVTYRLRENGLWSPPDIGSKSGLLMISSPLQPVPLWDTPTFHVDETFEGNIVAGSNAIRINFDRYGFWPWTPETPEVLMAHGLDHVPTAYGYGAVLPAGLKKELLESDIYTISFPNIRIVLRVVPEPASAPCFAMAALCFHLFRFRKRGNSAF